MVVKTERVSRVQNVDYTLVQLLCTCLTVQLSPLLPPSLLQQNPEWCDTPASRCCHGNWPLNAMCVGKRKVHTLDIAPVLSETSLQKCSGMARMFSRYFAVLPALARSSATGMSYTCLCIPSYGCVCLCVCVCAYVCVYVCVV